MLFSRRFSPEGKGVNRIEVGRATASGHFSEADYKQVRYRSSRLKIFFKTGVLKNFVKPEGLQLNYKEIPTQTFFCECSEIFWNSFFYKTPPVAASRGIHTNLRT